jgi:hypothetical protein
MGPSTRWTFIAVEDEGVEVEEPLHPRNRREPRPTAIARVTRARFMNAPPGKRV